jgi:undecaprenyl phosphate N,N'-diacetylbacillosamine 1-phosphate transferase
MYPKFFKPLFDLFFSLIGLILLSPILFLTTVTLFFSTGRSPFFVQHRPGKNSKIFKLYKFKTMKEKYDYEGKLLPDKDRLTTIGKYIRKTSIDELLQIINVLKGDMSLIGPRPLLVEYLQHYSQRQARRHNVKPGITGWAQVNGRNAISWQQKFEYDVWYVDNLSLLLDLKIIKLTILKIIKSEGINSNTTETMPTFTGE